MSLLEADILALLSILAQIAYLAELRDPNTGEYSHPAVADRSQAQELHRVLEKLHTQAFRWWLKLNIEGQKADLDLYLSGFGCDRQTVVKTWINLESYRLFVPASATKAERQLFIGDLQILLRLLAAQMRDASAGVDAVVTGPVLLTLKEVSASLRVPQRTLRLWAETGEVPALKAGRQWRFRREDIQRWLRERSS